jgi:uncharacterized membrane protein YhaH (DUF805 family)
MSIGKRTRNASIRYLIVSLRARPCAMIAPAVDRHFLIMGGIVMQWYLKVLQQYAEFTGRARRTEFWMFTLFSAIISVVLGLLDNLLGLTFVPGTLSGWLGLLYSLAVLLPSLGVSIRRLHDTGRSGWWLLIGLVPVVGAIVLIVFCATPGNAGANAHGPDPKASLDPAVA